MWHELFCHTIRDYYDREPLSMVPTAEQEETAYWKIYTESNIPSYC